MIIVGKGNTCLLAPNNNNTTNTNTNNTTATSPSLSHLASHQLQYTGVDLNFSDGVTKTVKTGESAM
jgi:hypothetical protein